MKRSLIVLALVVSNWSALPAGGQVYQFAHECRDVAGKEITAFLWVPPNADRLRGALVGGQTLMEREFASDPQIRQACTDERLAIVYFVPPLDASFNYTQNNCGELLQKALDELGKLSGYPELSAAPLLPFGHSVSSIFASRVVCWAPRRCFGTVAFKGGLSSPPDQPSALAGVPILVIKGQFEEFGPGPSGVLRDFEDRQTSWRGMLQGVLRRRQQDDRHLLSYLVEPGATHFAWSIRLSPYAAGFIRLCAQRRIPDWDIDAGQPIVCRDIAVASGALTGHEPAQAAVAAAYADFPGDKTKAIWHLDLDLARRADALHAELTTRKPQFVTFADPRTGKPIYVGHDLRLRTSPTWVGPDTFRVAGTFLDKAPDKYPKVEGPVGHAEGPVRFRAFGGPVEQVGPDTFRVRLDGLGRGQRAEILAFHPGDGTYRYAEQQARVSLPDRLTAGKPQAITFAAPPTLRPDSPPLRLEASSDAGLNVGFHVVSGPAVIEGGTLKLAEIPKRARFPLRIVVMAYQSGSAVEPHVQTAQAVKHAVTVDR